MDTHATQQPAEVDSGFAVKGTARRRQTVVRLLQGSFAHSPQLSRSVGRNTHPDESQALVSKN